MSESQASHERFYNVHQPHADVAPTDTPPVVSDDPVTDGDQPADYDEQPFDLGGTDAADRFELSAGYDHEYYIVGFDPSHDVIAFDGGHFGVDHITVSEIEDTDAIAGSVRFDQYNGDIFVGDHWLANISTDDTSGDPIALTADNFAFL